MKRWFVVLAVVGGACAAPPAPASPTATLWPAPSTGATSTRPAPAATPVIIASPTPPPTPVTHVVQAGETLIGLAVRYGLSLEALQQANPGVRPEALSVGAVLIIPAGDGSGGPSRPSAGSAPTPMPLTLSAPACAPTPSGVLYCFVEARNPGEVALEAVTARITLAGADGLPLADAMALPGLDVIPPGGALPLAAVFPDPPPAGQVAATGASVAAAYPLADLTARYVRLEAVVETNGAAGEAWRAAGVVRNVDERAAGTVRLLLVLYDAAGAVVGFRQATLDAGLAAGEAARFDLSALAVAGPAARGIVLAEGRP
mgnify:CR=1 FL=1